LEPLKEILGDKWESRWIEKTPNNVNNIREILKEFPQAKFLHIIRDGRDVVTSRLPGERWFQVYPMLWVEELWRGLAFIDHPSVYTFRYEDLIENFEETILDIQRFIEVEPSDRLLAYPKYATVQEFKNWEHSAIPVHNRVIGRWKNPEVAYRERVEEAMKIPEFVELLDQLGYLSEPRKPMNVDRTLRILSFPKIVYH